MMPLYFFDVSDGIRHVTDRTGTDFADKFEAVREAESLLKALRDIQVIEGRSRPAVVSVRDESGGFIHEATLHD
jgi:hypothetical protein